MCACADCISTRWVGNGRHQAGKMATVGGTVVGGSSGAAGQSLPQVNVFPDEKKIRELAEQIRARLSHAHQLKLQQQQAIPAAAMQISQAEEIKKRLQDVILKLQESVRDFSLTGVQEWLGMVAQRLSLKLEVQRSQQLQGTTVFLCHEGFYVEVCCQDNDTVTSVKLSQANTAQEDSVVLARLLVKRDFSAFETHLKSLVQFYNEAIKNCDPSLMYKALSAIEAVFIKINENSPQTATDKMIMENPLGHVTPRHGGLPMQLTFFVHPHEVIKNTLVPSELGVSVGVAGKVTMEKSPKVSMISTDPNLFDVSTASFFLMGVHNSATLPLTFVFELSEAIPICSLVRDELLKICGTEQSMLPMPIGSIHINQLVAKKKADKEGREVIIDKWRVVCLPEQYHYYLMPPELRSLDALPDQLASPQFCGAMVTKVPFLHPGKIFNIIMLLRKQLVYNALISSCMGRSKRGVPSPSTPDVSECIFEVASIPPNQVTVAMDMQSEETMIVDFIIPDQDPTAVKVMIKTNLDASAVLQDTLSDIAQRCLSVPVTLRAALKHPSRLLGNNPVLLLQKYRSSLSEFDKAVHSLEERELELMETAHMDVSDHVTLLGQEIERELTSMM